MAMYNNLQILLAALKPSQYRDYWKLWRGKDNNLLNDNIYKSIKWNKYLEDNKHKIYDSEPKFESVFIETFINEYNKNKKQFLLNTFYNEYKSISDNSLTYEDLLEMLSNDYSIDNITKFAKEYFQKINKYNNPVLNYKDFSMSRKEFIDKKTDDLKKEFLETLPPLEFNDISKIYEKLFNNKYRIYLPFKSKILNIDPEIISTYLEKFVKNSNIQDWEYNIQSTDDKYIKNKKTGKNIRFGKILDLLIKNKDDNKINDILDKIVETKDKFINRQDFFEGKIVISRHPYDIASMSTDRGWTNCMDLDRKEYSECHYIAPSITNGILIAYLVQENDTNITDPISRLLIKPYVEENKNIDFNTPNWLLKVSKIYGKNYSEFTNTVQKWLNDNWNSKIRANNKYKLLPNIYKEVKDNEYF